MDTDGAIVGGDDDPAPWRTRPTVAGGPAMAGGPAVAVGPGMIPQRADRSAIRRNNLEVVARHLAVAGRTSRAGIAAATGLTNSTVARLVTELAGLGLVRDVGTAPARGAGRPGAQVELDGTSLLVVGCEVNVHRMVVRVCDLGGRLRARVVRQGDASSISAATATRQLGRLCRQAIEQAMNERGGPQAGSGPVGGGLARGTALVRVVAAVPGTVDESTQTVITAPNLHWADFPFGAALGEALGLGGVAVTIGNDANFAALAEFWGGWHAGIDDLVYVTGDVGIGGGLIVGGRLLASANGQAGEVGHMTLDPDGPACACGRHGCWESYVGLGVLRDAIGPRDGSVSPAAFTASVARLARARDPAALGALSSVGSWLGLGLSNLINLLGTQRVVLGGYFAELSPWILPAAYASLAEHVFISQPIGSLVATSALGPDAAATGAALSAIDKVISDPTLLTAASPWMMAAGGTRER